MRAKAREPGAASPAPEHKSPSLSLSFGLQTGAGDPAAAAMALGLSREGGGADKAGVESMPGNPVLGKSSRTSSSGARTPHYEQFKNLLSPATAKQRASAGATIHSSPLHTMNTTVHSSTVGESAAASATKTVTAAHDNVSPQAQAQARHAPHDTDAKQAAEELASSSGPSSTSGPTSGGAAGAVTPDVKRRVRMQKRFMNLR